MKKTIIYCKKCGEEREIYVHLLAKGRGKYCSITCARKDHPPTWMHKDYTGRGMKVSLALKGKSQDNNSRFWKGDNVGYRGLHLWVQKHLGKANHCEKDISHKSTRYHWGNISKDYKRDLSDWMQLCPSCNLLDRKVKVNSY